jgi:hypothetical protein
VRQLMELLRQFGDPQKKPAKVIPWPKPVRKRDASPGQDRI